MCKIGEPPILCIGALRRQGMFMSNTSRTLFDGLPSDDPPTRIRAFAGLAGGSKTVGTGEPENGTFPFGQIISKPIEKAPRRLGPSVGAGI